jgi:lysine/ornithine N-monooxygenase
MQWGASERITLHIYNLLTDAKESSAAFDFVFVASGYQHGIHDSLTQGLRSILDSPDGQVTVDNDYAINFKRKAVACGSGVWLLDYLDVSQDDVFSFLALQTQRVLNSLLGECESCKLEKSEDPKEISML